MATFTSDQYQYHYQYQYYSPDDPKHQCCCGSCHVVTGTWIFLVLYTLGTLPEIFVGLPVSFLGGFIPVAIIIITAIGLLKEEPCAMWPFIILSGISFVLTVFIAIMIITWSMISVTTIFHALEDIEKKINGSSVEHWSFELFVTVMVMIELLLVASMVCCFWQLQVAYQCKQYFEEKRWLRMNASQQQQYFAQSEALLRQQQPIIISNHFPPAPPTYSALMTEDVK